MDETENKKLASKLRKYRARLFQGYLVGAAVGFMVLLFYARYVAYFEFDLSVTRWLQHWQATWFDLAMQAVTQVGLNPFAPIFTASVILLAFIIGFRWEAVMLLVTSVGVGLLDGIVKALAYRPRPTRELVNVFYVWSGPSFPSGHVMFYVAFLGFLLFLLYTLMPRSWLRTSSLIILGTLIALIGVASVYLAYHWPSDVIGAYLLGSLWLAVTIYIYRKGKSRFFLKKPIAAGKPEIGK